MVFYVPKNLTLPCKAPDAMLADVEVYYASYYSTTLIENSF